MAVSPAMSKASPTSLAIGPTAGSVTRLTLSTRATEQPHAPADLTLVATLTSPDLDARADVHGEYLGWGGLVELFAEMATDWKGWVEPKTWTSGDSRLSLSATADATGHVSLGARLRESPSHELWQVHAAVDLEAGSLDEVHNQVKDFVESLTI